MKKLIIIAIVLLASLSANAQDTIRIDRKQVKEILPEYRLSSEPNYFAIVYIKGKRYVVKLTKTEKQRFDGEPNRQMAIIELKSYTKLIVL